MSTETLRSLFYRIPTAEIGNTGIRILFCFFIFLFFYFVLRKHFPYIWKIYFFYLSNGRSVQPTIPATTRNPILTAASPFTPLYYDTCSKRARENKAIQWELIVWCRLSSLLSRTACGRSREPHDTRLGQIIISAFVWPT